MPVEIIMPKVDMDMTSGKIMVWHVAEGEAVAQGAALFDIETDKAAMEVEAAGSGILHHPVPEGTEVAIGQPVGWLYAPDEAVGTAPATTERASDPEPEPAPAPETATPEPPTDRTIADKPRATPRARKLAREGALELAGIDGTGPRGRVQAEDVTKLLRQTREPAAPATFEAHSGPLAVSKSRGGSGTPLVFLHGFAGEGQSWAALEAHLKHRPRIRIDLPCHGKSPNLRIARFTDLVEAVRTAFDALDLDAAHLVGHSLGGALALALADTRPRRVASLSLIAPAGLGPDVHGDALAGIGRATRTESLAPWLRTLVADETMITDSFARLAMDARRDPEQRAAQQALAEAVFPDGVQAFDLRAALQRVTCPTTILWGKADRIIPWRHALCAPGRTALHLFDNVGHMPQIEAPEEIGKVLAARL